MSSIFNALEDARAESADRSICYQEVADKLGVSRSTVSRNDRGVTLPRAIADAERWKLSPQQERELCEYIEVLTARHLPPTRQMVQNFASKIAHDYISNAWVTRFINKHSNTLLYK